jgi:hypothetical protein
MILFKILPNARKSPDETSLTEKKKIQTLTAI